MVGWGVLTVWHIYSWHWHDESTSIGTHVRSHVSFIGTGCLGCGICARPHRAVDRHFGWHCRMHGGSLPERPAGSRLARRGRFGHHDFVVASVRAVSYSMQGWLYNRLAVHRRRARILTDLVWIGQSVGGGGVVYDRWAPCCLLTAHDWHCSVHVTVVCRIRSILLRHWATLATDASTPHRSTRLHASSHRTGPHRTTTIPPHHTTPHNRHAALGSNRRPLSRSPTGGSATGRTCAARCRASPSPCTSLGCQSPRW